jgi:FkbM family methyltransferase
MQMNNVKCGLDTGDRGISSHIITNCIWEPWETALVRKIATHGQIWIEIGANLGYYTVDLARLIGSTGKLISFEASPNLAKLVKDSIIVNGFDKIVDLYDNAVWDVDNVLVPFTNPDILDHMEWIGGSSIQYDYELKHNVNVIHVKTVTLDTIVPNNLQANFIKMDVEGAECHILHGAQETIKRSTDIKIIMEGNVSLQARASTDVSNCLNVLYNDNFSFFKIIDNGDLLPMSVNELETTPDHIDIFLDRIPDEV